jgi:hypothetical protein
MELEGYSLVVLDRLRVLISIMISNTLARVDHTVLCRLRRDSAPYCVIESQ